MAIKTSNAGPHKPTNFAGMPRGTYRSNVKSRKLNQNGLEAQYQGLDIREVNIDHAGLGILGRGGTGFGMREIVKTKRRYKVLLPVNTAYPELTFELKPDFTGNQTLSTLYADTNTRVRISDFYGNTQRYQFTRPGTPVEVLPNGYTSVPLDADNDQDPNDHLTNLKIAIERDFGVNMFKVELELAKSRMKITSIASPDVGQLSFGCSPATILDSFQSQNESHIWTLDGYTVQKPIPNAFYEDVRVDTIYGSAFSLLARGEYGGENYVGTDLGRGPQQSTGVVTPAGAPIVNLEAYLSGTVGTLPASADPTLLEVGTTLDSDEIRIEQLPARQKIFNTFEDNFQWREDIHYLHPDEQVWSKMQDKAKLYVESSDVVYYGSIFEQHIANMMDSNFADEQYIVKAPMSGRVDVYNRLSRHYGLHLDVMTERHQYSILDQYVEQSMDMANIQRNTVPIADVLEGQLAFEDNDGRLFDKDIQPTELKMDYFDQRYVDAHDFKEEERYTRIDDEMLSVITPEYIDDNGKLKRIDRREYQQPNYIHTTTGFVSSQVTGHTGIMFRDLMR